MRFDSRRDHTMVTNKSNISHTDIIAASERNDCVMHPFEVNFFSICVFSLSLESLQSLYQSHTPSGILLFPLLPFKDTFSEAASTHSSHQFLVPINLKHPCITYSSQVRKSGKHNNA